MPNIFSIANLKFPDFRTALNNVLNGLMLHGQCRFDYVNSTTCRLSRLNGRYIQINGKVEEIPAAGVDFAVSGLSALTLYYAYVWMDNGTMKSEWATTGHSIDSATGVEIKTGDATRTLVGMAYTESGPVFLSSASRRYVASWFNRRRRTVTASFTADRQITSVTPNWAEFNTEIRVALVCWAGEDVIDETFNGRGWLGGTAYSGSLGVSLDSGTAAPSYTWTAWYGLTSNLPVSATGLRTSLTEGYHFLTLTGQVSATGNLNLGAGARMTLSVNI